MRHSYRIRVFIVLMIAALPFAAAFADPIARNTGSGTTMEWQVNASGYEKVQLRWIGPDGDVGFTEFSNGKRVSLSIADLGTDPQDGEYTWELWVTPKVPKDVAAKLAAARAANDDKAAKKILKDAGLSADRSASGAFALAHGLFVNTEGTEGSSRVQTIATNARASAPIAANDQVIADDLIVQGSLCVGFDCVNNESFGFDTIRLKENNTRIKFDDTSSTAGYSANDWQLTANDSASGGASKFSIEDITGAKVPFTVRGSAPNNSIYVDTTGRVGFRTATPVLDLHVNTSDSPAIRLEQNNSGGWTAQTWDIAGNEANFFVRDVTSGSRLPFRIRPGAPTSSIDISADGYVGLGGITQDIAPYTAVAQVISSAELGNFFRLYNSNTTYEMGGMWQPNAARTAGWLFGTANSGAATFTYGSGTDEDNALTDAKDTGDGISITTSGNVGINCNAPGSDFVISATTNCSGSQSTINAGSSQFTTSSSRTIKENLEPVAVPDLLDRIANVDVYHYDFINGPKNRLGLMAEDFYGVFGRGSDKLIDGNDVQMALWLAVQQLAAENKELRQRLNALESRQ